MKFAFMSDVHLSGYPNDKKDEKSNLSERLLSLKNSLNGVVYYCRENKIKVIKIGGDTLHNKSIIHTIAQSVLLNFVRENKDIHFDFIDGNHDLDGKGQGVVSALLPLDMEPNVRRIGTEHGALMDEVEGIYYVPYSSNMLSEIKNGKAKILIAHLGLNEGVLNSGQSIVAELKMKDLVGKYDLVLLGHYHTPQEISNENIRIFYAGSLIHLDWKDKNEEKRFLVVDSDTLDVISVPTTGYRKYMELKITNENKNEIIEQAKLLKSEGHAVHIRKDIEVDTKDIEQEFMIVDRTEKDITNRGLSTSMTEIEIIDKYLNIKNIKKEEQEIYRAVAMEIISQSEVI